MKQYDLLIKNAYVFPLKKIRDIAIKGEKIVELKEGLSIEDATEVIDVQNKLVTPAFVDASLHIDKAYLSDEYESCDVLSACTRSWKIIEEKYTGWDDDDIIEEIVERGSKVIENCIKNGTGYVKNNVTVNKSWGLISLKAMDILKEKYKGKITIKNVVVYDKYFEKEWIEAVEKKQVDFIGGYVNIEINEETGLPQSVAKNYSYVDKIFELSAKYDLPIDIFFDETADSCIDMLTYVANTIIKNDLSTKITCSGLSGLGSPDISEDDAAMAIAIAAKARMNIVSLTSCDLNLGDIRRRSTTRVKQIYYAGMNISTASGNIRDSFRPYGNCDLMEETLLTANLHKFDTVFDMKKLMYMITFNPANNLLLEDYGILLNCYADLVVFDAPTEHEAILSQSEKDYVIYHGKVVSEKSEIKE